MTISFTFSRKESKRHPSMADCFHVYISILRFSCVSVLTLFRQTPSRSRLRGFGVAFSFVRGRNMDRRVMQRIGRPSGRAYPPVAPDCYRGTAEFGVISRRGDNLRDPAS